MTRELRISFVANARSAIWVCQLTLLRRDYTGNREHLIVLARGNDEVRRLPAELAFQSVK